MNIVSCKLKVQVLIVSPDAQNVRICFPFSSANSLQPRTRRTVGGFMSVVKFLSG